MENLHLDPFETHHDCEVHGKNVIIVIQPRKIDFVKKEIVFIYFCKRCQKIGKADAWRSRLSFSDFNELFGYDDFPITDDSLGSAEDLDEYN